MTNTDRMMAWLREALDAAWRDAEAATPGPWEPEGDDPTDDVVYTIHDGEQGDLVGNTVAHVRGGNAVAANVRHIARHDPAAVLRRITADRQLLELHAAVPDHGRFSERGCPALCDGEHPESPVCRTCRDYAGDPGEAPCATVRLLAEGYGWTEGTTESANLTQTP